MSRGLSAEIIAVGTELLLGDAVDTNSAHLSRRLAEIGVDVYRHTTVGDNPLRLEAAIADACGRADAVLVTGGLGPTQDDLTRDAVAALAGVPLERDGRLVAHLDRFFRDRGREMPEANLRQADLPAGARVLEPVGTAAGFALEVAGATVYCLPGVPREMAPMADAEVVPELAGRAGAQVTVSRLVRTAGMSESLVAERAGALVERLEDAGNPTVAFLASRGETRVRVTGKAGSREAALALVDPVVEELVDLLGAGVAGLDDEGVEQAVARQLRERGWTLALAESVTGGLVTGRLVGVVGASDWLRGGLVVYTTASKRALAGLGDVLEAHGPVSEATSIALAAAARERLDGDVGVGVTGVAGPDARGGLAPGTIIVAVDLPDRPPGARTVALPPRERPALLEFATSAVLDHLRRALADVDAPGW